ncbi:MAG: hypothetical protein OXI95_09645 [bacterium]|nr:hypothetical protein [bacterium]MDE0417183.1 hypothetical protein [bacterium]
MKQAEARRRIILEFDVWARSEGLDHPNGTDGLRFFARMRSERPEMLAFGCRGDHWEVVHGWLLNADRVSD